jgi:hypothetical protein
MKISFFAFVISGMGLAVAAPVGAQPLIGFTVGYEVHWSCPGELAGECEEPLFVPYERDAQLWWYDLVEEVSFAGVQYIAPVDRGCSPCGSQNMGDMCPRELDKLVTAIEARGLDDQVKVAIFDDTAAYAAQKNWCKHGTGAYEPQFDVGDETGGDAGEGGWSYVWDQNWRIFYQTVQDRHLFKIGDRPLVIMWSGSNAFFTNQAGNFSRLIGWLRERCQEEFGFNPYIVVDWSWLDVDPTANDPAVIDGVHSWFNPEVSNTTTYSWNGRDYTVAVPAFRDKPGSAPMRVQPRDHALPYDAALAGAASSFLVLVEGFTDIFESAGLYRSYEWDFPNQYLDVTRRHARPGLDHLVLEAEAADGYFDATPGNEGGAYRISGDLDIQLSGDGINWNVGWIDPGEWIEFVQVELPAGSYVVGIRYAAVENDRTVHAVIDGAALPGAVLPSTGDWQSYAASPIGSVDLAGGEHALRLVFDSGGMNVDWFSVGPDVPMPDDDGREPVPDLADEEPAPDAAVDTGPDPAVDGDGEADVAADLDGADTPGDAGQEGGTQAGGGCSCDLSA